MFSGGPISVSRSCRRSRGSISHMQENPESAPGFVPGAEATVVAGPNATAADGQRAADTSTQSGEPLHDPDTSGESWSRTKKAWAIVGGLAVVVTLVAGVLKIVDTTSAALKSSPSVSIPL